MSADYGTSRAWKIDRLFEQLDEDGSGSLDEHELFKLMQMVAAARSERVPDQDLRNDGKEIIRKRSKEVQGKIVLKEFQQYVGENPEKFKDIIRLRNVFQMFSRVPDTMDYEAMTKLVAEVKKKKPQSTLDVGELYRRFGNGSSDFTFDMFAEMYHTNEDFGLLEEEEVPRKRTAGSDEGEDENARKKARAPEGRAAGACARLTLGQAERMSVSEKLGFAILLTSSC